MKVECVMILAAELRRSDAGKSGIFHGIFSSLPRIHVLVAAFSDAIEGKNQDASEILVVPASSCGPSPLHAGRQSPAHVQAYARVLAT